ncbi:iron only hydrogenase large subunit [Halobacteroides halobius DSM 5150]|uniref:Iron only hydrogenase large subunit n=1 Tax=Halobacteroides halobius (strain ATCC 35273 / DSM 5150 / MD-1) TaxID=748449 RepID=L0KCW1_HALHC|nr:[Fe-Fe] hydrogenase large subunit C-terminal domain-containing protein [Halobacteroides halobius]AGB41913.1 iron only hydrogenase large subunit [Halobacteroides halobius DSM 5150]
MNKSHSVHLKEDKCEGCTNCVQNCPTKAIRVHQGQAWIKDQYCIDCGECIRNCEHHAKHVITGELKEIQEYEYSIAVVPPSFYGQFTEEIDPVHVTIGLKELGFKEVWDAALGAEALTRATRDYLKNNEGPIISSACPAVVRLIKLLYPELIDYLLPLKPPVEIVAQKIRQRVKKSKGFDDDQVGVFFITPCPAKMTAIKNPLGMEESFFTGAIAVDKIYRPLLQKVKELKTVNEKDYKPPYLGIGWANSGGESGLINNDTIAVSGIHNVISVLEELDRGDLSHIKFFELLACEPGCVGGVLNVKNPFLAQFNIKKLIKQGDKLVKQEVGKYDFILDNDFESNAVGPLDDDFNSAIAKLAKLKDETDALPGLDCAACGTPDCKTLAEDIVNGLASRSDCVFILRQQLADLTDQMTSLAHSLPPVMQREDKSDET